MEFREIERIVGMLRYKPGSRLSVRRQGERAIFTLQMRTHDANDPGSMTSLVVEQSVQADHLIDLQDVLEFINEHVLWRFERHEVKEWFTIQREHVYEPH